MPSHQSAVRASRRDFLKTASAATLGAPYFLTSAALGQGDRPPASERLTMGSIGTGGMGRGDLGAFLRMPDVQVVAVCDVDKKMRDMARDQVERHYAAVKVSGEYRGCDTYGDFRELTAREDIDAVHIATPDHWHALTAISAAKNGKDMYCQKPMSLTIREGRAMATAVRRYGRVFQTGSQQRSSHEFLFACEMVRSGRIGKVHTVYVHVGGPSRDCYLPAEPCPEGFDFDFWLGPAPERPYNHGLHPFTWRSYRDYSGGGMTDWGAHHFDIAQWGLGMDHSGPVEVTPPDGKNVKLLTYKYANGVTMYHNGAPGGSPGVTFLGTDGRIDVGRGVLKTVPEDLKDRPTEPGEVHLYHSREHHADLIDCIRTRRRPICDVEIGCRSVTVCHLGNIAYWLKRPLKWDPVKEEFVGDAEANRWLERPYRGEWKLEV